ncbi:hypothetical protein D9615_006601 [Tricholomella constricta]|uniref:S-adenosyl-L-methionine-dependent methyltransferase n=1 Tax=Tricholomella constricta TaxID=117010 RepID=A0A8H5M3H0_9AGAR|nr:hypothetical protein D9615_006601 [Tricholomella constricta]
MSSSPIRNLLNLLTDSVNKLETACNASGCPIPDLYASFNPASEAFRADPIAAEAASIICAAALQMEAILTPPNVSLYHIVSGHCKSAALRVCLESNVTEILREAGPGGIHVNDIACKNKQDPRKLGRFIRYLATHHIYREVEPNVFANTRISSMMDTLKPSKEIIDHPETKHENTPGLAALASHHLDEAFKASAVVWETLTDPATAYSGDPRAAPVSRAFGIQDSFWDLLGRDKPRARRFNIGMQGVQALEPVDAILEAYDWKELPGGSVVVDVGGGVGTASLVLAREFPDLEIVVQDLPGVIDDAKKLWATTMPNRKVTLEVQDFFNPQPTKRSVSVFLLKQVTHDWSDEYCVKFLTQLRAAAQPDTKLIIVDSIVPFACRDTSGDDNRGIPGAVPREAPAPLLANYGAVNEMAYNADIAMFLFFNSQERNIRHIDDLLLSAGWNLRMVRRQKGGSHLHSIEATPV